MSKTVEKLKRVEQLIQRSNQWIQNDYTRRVNGRICYCLIGALNVAEGRHPAIDNPDSRTKHALKVTLEKVTNSTACQGTLADFNDASTHSEVLGLVRATIKRLSK